MVVQAAPQAKAQSAGSPLHIVHGQIVDGANSVDATLSSAVDYLQKVDPTANIVVPEEMGQIKIGDLQLRDAPVGLALEALSVASGNKFMVREENSGSKRLFIIQTNQPPHPPRPEVTVEAFNLTGYLQHLNPGNLLHLELSGKGTNVNTILDQLKDTIVTVLSDVADQRNLNSSAPLPRFVIPPAPQFKFYEYADLFIVIGSGEAVETARKIVNALPGEESQDGKGFNPLGTMNMNLLQGQQNGQSSQFFKPWSEPASRSNSP